MIISSLEVVLNFVLIDNVIFFFAFSPLNFVLNFVLIDIVFRQQMLFLDR